MSVGERKELYRIYLINTENPCVGGSIPSLPTSPGIAKRGLTTKAVFCKRGFFVLNNAVKKDRNSLYIKSNKLK